MIEPEYWKENLEDTKTMKQFFDAVLDDENDVSLFELITTPEKTNSKLKQGRLDLICSHLKLLDVDMDLACELFALGMRKQRKNYLKVYRRIAEGLKELEDTNPQEYDYIFIDCPPNFNIVTKSSIVASDYILIPAKPDYLSTLGIDYLQRSVNDLIREYNEYAAGENCEIITPQVLGVVFTMVQFYDSNPIAAQSNYITRTKRLGMPVFSTYLRENKSLFATNQETGIPVVLNRYSNQGFQNIVTEITELVNEFESILG